MVISMRDDPVGILVDAEGRRRRDLDKGHLEAHQRDVNHRLAGLGFAPRDPWETSRDSDDANLATRYFTLFTTSPPVRAAHPGSAGLHYLRALRGAAWNQVRPNG